jgi:transketolase
MITKEKFFELQARALHLRIDSIRATTANGSGHPTTCMSAADIISALFFYAMKFDVSDPKNKNNDRFILSKGHGVPAVYAAYKQLGVISDVELMQLREFTSPLEGHPTPRFIFNEAATGSLGQGLAIAVGMALSARFDKRDFSTYVLFGDGELAEGSIWEAAELASYYKLGSIIGFVDCNRMGQTGQTLVGHDIERHADKCRAFGWHVITIDGHDIEAICKAIDDGKKETFRPTMIIAKTYKGYGVAAFEDKNGHHGKPVAKEELAGTIETLKQRFTKEYEYPLQATKKTVKITPRMFPTITLDIKSDKNKELFAHDKKMSTRKAFGYGLAALGRVSNDVIAIDADVKNSTYVDIFESEFPDRLIQCFIAEQTMVGVATGLESREKIPFASTFGAFFTRAHDQIRMAGIGRNALRLCGSHSGVSIGEDGPSQMALEDLAMMRSIPNSVVLYPSDAVSAYKLVGVMAQYNDGISYMRTTRSDTAILYDLTGEFIIGGSRVLRQSENDKACIVAAGITLHEALRAYEMLKQKNIFVSVVDAYSVKPLDTKTITAMGKKSGNRIITVEDHYIEGGLGEAVASALVNESIKIDMLAVKKVSRSGKQKDLLAYAEIDAEAIIRLV